MAKLYLQYLPKTGSETLNPVVLDKVVDAGIAVDFLVIRYQDGVVTGVKTDLIESWQFDPTEDAVPEENVEAENDTPSQ